MAKRRSSQRKDNRNSKSRSRLDDSHPQDMDDEIDAFHKQRDVVPLDINGDIGESSDDDEEPVFDDEDINGKDEDSDNDEDDAQDSRLSAKIVRQQKFLREKFGELDDEMHDDEKDEGEEKFGWGGRKGLYYNTDIRDSELESSDDEAPQEEEAEVLRLQKEKAKFLSKEDFGLEDVSEDDSDRELTLEEISVKGKGTVKTPLTKESVDDMGLTFEEVKKDLNALSREEQMDIVYSSAPELVGLLSELSDALEQLETRVNPLLSKVKLDGATLDGGIRYLEVKQLLLLAYCQAITFYLVLKSEGQPVRDHPVIARLVEIKGLLDKMKQLDENLPVELEEFLKKNSSVETVKNPAPQNVAPVLTSDSVTKDHDSSLVSANAEDPAQSRGTYDLVKVKPLRGQDNKKGKQKHKGDHVGVQSMEMLKVRAALEEKLKQKGVFNSLTPKPDRALKRLKPVNGQLETYDDFNDDAIVVERGNRGLSNGHASSLGSTKLSQLVASKQNKPKVISGDDDLPKRDDIGERRRKHELRVLAHAGIKSEEDAGNELDNLGSDGTSDMAADNDTGGSEDEFYKQVKQKRAEKLAAKAEIYARTPAAAPSLPETVDGKRHITYQIEKNRGLTRPRKKLTKNPRKKYRTKHDKAQMRRKGQVREIRKPVGPYGGETSGINAGISRSIRF